MSQEIVGALETLVRAITSSIEKIGSRVIDMIAPLKVLPQLMEKQSAFIEEGFASQTEFAGGMHLAARRGEIAKKTQMLSFEEKRLTSRRDEYLRQIESVRERAGQTIENVDADLDRNVRELDSYALQFMDTSYDRRMRAHLPDLELPHREMMDSDDDHVLATRLKALAREVGQAQGQLEMFLDGRKTFDDSLDPFLIRNNELPGGDSARIEAYVAKFVDSMGQERTLVVPPSEIGGAPSDWETDFKPLIEDEGKLRKFLAKATSFGE